MKTLAPSQSDALIAEHARGYLEQVVAIESSSDEDSSSIPSTEGQATLARHVGAFFEAWGASVEQDDNANVIASFAGRGRLADAEPLALMVHLDTAKGTEPAAALELAASWDGSALTWPGNPNITVDVATYPSLAAFVGHGVLHASGAAPFGLDDKLGLTHMMTLAWLLHSNPDIPHPPLLLIGRPDEEIGRMEALHGLAAMLAERGVRSGYTVDGIEPFEVNVENFNAAGASVLFPTEEVDLAGRELVAVRLSGVNTHGATAYAEGHRAATRLAAELASIVTPVAKVVGFKSDPHRDCDADVVFASWDHGDLFAALEHVVADHRPRGAGWEEIPVPAGFVADGAAERMLRWVAEFLASAPGFTLLAEDSYGHDGYSHPYRAFPMEQGVRLDVRLRDFAEQGLRDRIAHVQGLAGNACSVTHQYVNMGPRLVDRPELVRWAKAAGLAISQEVPVLPIRGGTGVDPFLDAGVAVANLGTGYFAPESEKELTSMEMLAGHARWLVALVQQVG
ncbi:MAG: hypothetical protein KDA24_17330 [Deltaproteobacteria bacterium]|nr:hypothetical protein [Deltaproteobacteria bacterium]